MTLLGVKGVYGSTNKPPINTITIWADPITQIHILKISWYWAYVRPQERERDNVSKFLICHEHKSLGRYSCPSPSTKKLPDVHHLWREWRWKKIEGSCWSQNNIFLLGNIAVNVRCGDVAFDKIFLFHSIRLLFVKMLVNFYLSHLVTLN